VRLGQAGAAPDAHHKGQQHVYDQRQSGENDEVRRRRLALR
jgi:transcriptional regulator NrdR family protein